MIKKLAVSAFTLVAFECVTQPALGNIFASHNQTAIKVMADVQAEDILKKAIDAYGGEKAIAALKDIQLTGSVDVMGQSLEYLQKNIFPSGFSTTVLMGGSTLMKQSKKDGAYALMMPGGNIGEIDEAAKEEIDTRAAFFAERYMLATQGYAYKLNGKEQIGGKDAYSITITSPRGVELIAYYDVTSGLKVQDKRESESPMGGGKITITTLYNDYKIFDGFTVPTRLTVDLGQFSQDILITDVKLNQGLQLADL